MPLAPGRGVLATARRIAWWLLVVVGGAALLGLVGFVVLIGLLWSPAGTDDANTLPLDWVAGSIDAVPGTLERRESASGPGGRQVDLTFLTRRSRDEILADARRHCPWRSYPPVDGRLDCAQMGSHIQLTVTSEPSGLTRVTASGSRD